VSEQDRALSPRVGRRRRGGGGRIGEVVFEIGELDNPSQGARWAGCVSDALHVSAVVVAFGAGEKHKRAELNRAQPPGAQLADGDVRALQHVVQPGSDPHLPGGGGRDPADVINERGAGRGLLTVVSGGGDRPLSALSHRMVPDVVSSDAARTGAPAGIRSQRFR
jgi:hypothetical protein